MGGIGGQRKRGYEAAAGFRDSCTAGQGDGEVQERRVRFRGLDDAEDSLYQDLMELESSWGPSNKQSECMRQLCIALHLSFTEEVKGLDCQEKYSKKLDDLLQRNRDRKAAIAEEVSPAQLQYLTMLRAKPDELANLTKESASDLIALKLAAKEAQPPTQPQLDLLKALKYDGPTPTSRNKASQLIGDIKQQKRIAFLVEKAERRGMSAAHIQGIVALVKKHGL